MRDISIDNNSCENVNDTIAASSLSSHSEKEYPGQSRSVVNGRAPINYDRKRQPFTLTVYGIHIRCFTVYYDYRKQ